MPGVKGKSGRKSKYQEEARARALAEMYYDPQDQEVIENRIREGRFSIRDRHILNAMEGDTRAIAPIFMKLHPDKMDLTSGGDKIKQIPIYGGLSVSRNNRDKKDIRTDEKD